MPKKISNIIFQKSTIHYYNELKKGYLEELEKASDKEYAKKHWQKVFFTENEYVPYKSVLFNELKFIYHHHNCLDSETAYNKTVELIPQVRIISEKRKNDATSLINGNKDIDLADWYLEQIEAGTANLNELIQIEERYVIGKIDRDLYMKYKTQFEKELIGIREEMENSKFNLSNLDLVIEKAVKSALNLHKIWISGDLEEKRRIQKLVLGIKGQYLLLDDNRVLNIRKHEGYYIDLTVVG